MSSAQSFPNAFPPPSSNHSKAFGVLFGAFHVGGFRLPYFITVMSFTDIASSFSLVEDYPLYKTQDWKLEELYQRSLNHERVRDIATTYLSPGVAGRPPFFNSITIALNAQLKTPKSPEGLSKFNGTAKSYGLRGLSISTNATEKFGALEVPQSGAAGQACWLRTDELMAVAIDGQHRLAAIKEFVKQDQAEGYRSFMSVVVLVLDEEFGFASPSKMSSLDAMRSVFIDLNKHAVSVSTARNILLDDQSAYSRCVRAIISGRLALSALVEGTTHSISAEAPRADGEFSRRVPLALIDWHTEHKSKFDEGPYVSSVLALSWCVEKIMKHSSAKCFKIPARFDPDTDNPYKSFGRAINQLSLGNQCKDRLAECESATPPRPFHFDKEELDAIGEKFSEQWGGALTTLLCELLPYRTVVRMRMNNKSVTPQFTQWYEVYADTIRASASVAALKQAAESRMLATDQAMTSFGVNPRAFEDIVKKVNIFKKDNIFFLLVTQRAIVLGFIDSIGSHQDTRDMAKSLSLDAAETVRDPNGVVAQYCVVGLNSIIEADQGLFTRKTQVAKRPKSAKHLTMPDRMWAGSLFRPDAPDNADFSEVAARRASIWIRICIQCYWIAKHSGIKRLREVSEDLLRGVAFVGMDVHERGLVEAMGRLLPPKKKISPGTSPFYESPANHLAGMPESRVTDAWIERREALAEERVRLIIDAVVKAIP